MPKTSVLPTYGHLKAAAVSSRLTKTYPHKDMIRGFHLFSEAWYVRANRDLVDEIMIGFYGPDGDQGTTGEFGIRWTELGGKNVPQLQVYDDAWEALAHFSDLLAEMGKLNNTNPTPKEFCELLKRLGIKDLTPRNQK